jgi:hypothetical protein
MAVNVQNLLLKFSDSIHHKIGNMNANCNKDARDQNGHYTRQGCLPLIVWVSTY